MAQDNEDEFNVENKMEILKYYDDAVKTRNISSISVELGISESRLRSILTNRKLTEELAEKGVINSRFGKFKNIEIALIAWMRKMRSENVKLTKEIVLKKAYAFGKMSNFCPRVNRNWFPLFSRRHNLDTLLKLNPLETSEADTWSRFRMLTLLKQYLPQDIFVMDEFSLVYDLLPTCLISKKPNADLLNRFSVILGTNSTGTEKLKLFVVGKSNQEVENLPLKYFFNPKAYVTRAIFVEWLQSLQCYLEYKNRNIVIVLDKCSVHPEELIMNNIKLVFLPATQEKSQPLHAGIIRKVKEEYRHTLLQQYYNANTDESKPVVLQKALEHLADAWNKIEPEFISRCFRKTGFAYKIDLEDDIMTAGEVPEIFAQYPGYLNIDDDDPTCEEAITARVDEDKPQTVTEAQAVHAVQQLRTYLSSPKNKEALEYLDCVEKGVLGQDSGLI